MAVIMLGSQFVDQRAVPVLREVLSAESDAKIRAHAEVALARLRVVGAES